jgi:tetratricopeptide (TPR) repeat protein
MAMLPLICFAALEISLRIAGYGLDTRQWVEKGDKYIINPDLALRYFNKVKKLPSTIQDVFDIEKKENAYRIFVLGGSSAAGFPYMPMGSFSRYIRKRLEMNYPDKHVEVVNIAMAAVNSYTLLDLIPGVIEKEPDVILIYAGHNEYYGALGVGSMESFSSSRAMVNTILYLNHFKTTQFIRNVIKGDAAKSMGEREMRSGTLMARMAEKKSIPYGSPLFHQGIDQFEGNLRAIIEFCKEAGVPLLLGRLTSNTKDQKPFKNATSSRHPSAQEVFERANSALVKNEIKLADSLFTLAKDLDALRFRAPGEMNRVITELGKELNVPVVDVDCAFRAASRNNIVGDELITDHLHPTVEGYQLMGKTYYEGMHDHGFLPGEPPFYPYEKQHGLTVANFVITDLDRKIGDYTILKLKNDWPFIHPNEKKPLKTIIKINNNLDALSLQVANHEKKWLIAHMELAKAAMKKKDMDTFLKHMNVLIYQYPTTKESYDLVIHESLKLGRLSDALPYLQMRYQMGTNAFISKWMGIVFISMGKGKKAVPYLEESVLLDPGDPQTFYNLCVGHLHERHYGKARQALKRCLRIAPDFPGAIELLKQIEKHLGAAKAG